MVAQAMSSSIVESRRSSRSMGTSSTKCQLNLQQAMICRQDVKICRRGGSICRRSSLYDNPALYTNDDTVRRRKRRRSCCCMGGSSYHHDLPSCLHDHGHDDQTNQAATLPQPHQASPPPVQWSSEAAVACVTSLASVLLHAHQLPWQFAEASYWDKRYKEEGGKPFEWWVLHGHCSHVVFLAPCLSIALHPSDESVHKHKAPERYGQKRTKSTKITRNFACRYGGYARLRPLLLRYLPPALPVLQV